MDQIYARIKRLRNDPYRRIVSGQKLFDLDTVSVDSCDEYDPSTLLDEGEWYKIADFLEKEFSLQILDGGLVSADVHELVKGEFDKISYLMSVQGGTYFFQRVRSSALLRRKLIAFGDVATLEEPSSRIVVNPQPDAIFVPESNALLFRDLAAISPIFPGIDTLYRQATDEQVAEFLGYDFIETDLQPISVSKANRKRIALAMDSLSEMSSADRDEIFAYIGDYTESKLKFDSDAGVFTVANDEELKILVYGIEQRFYTTLIGSEKRLANSIVKLLPE